MTILKIDRRDIQCTILEGVRELLGEFQITEVDGNMNAYAERISGQVLACGDKVGARIEAIWLRTDGSPEIEKAQAERDPADRDQVLRVLVKLVDDPHWRIAVEYQVSPTGQLISHITEGHALERKPVDPVTGKDGSWRAAEHGAVTDGRMAQGAVIYDLRRESSVELVDEGAKIRVRVREPSGKASIFIDDADLDRLGKEVAYMQKQRAKRAREALIAAVRRPAPDASILASAGQQAWENITGRRAPTKIEMQKISERNERINDLISRMSLAKENGDFYRWLATSLVDLEDRLDDRLNAK